MADSDINTISDGNNGAPALAVRNGAITPEKYRALFETIDEGFAVMEMIRDPSGRICDVFFLEVNRAFERHTGMENMRGKRRSETGPQVEDFWFQVFEKVAR